MPKFDLELEESDMPKHRREYVILEGQPIPEPKKRPGGPSEVIEKMAFGDCVEFEPHEASQAGNFGSLLRRAGHGCIQRIVENGKIRVWKVKK